MAQRRAAARGCVCQSVRCGAAAAASRPSKLLHRPTGAIRLERGPTGTSLQPEADRGAPLHAQQPAQLTAAFFGAMAADIWEVLAQHHCRASAPAHSDQLVCCKLALSRC
jgi:hypothetical protein